MTFIFRLQNTGFLRIDQCLAYVAKHYETRPLSELSMYIAKTSRLSSFKTRYGGLSTFETICNVLAIGKQTSHCRCVKPHASDGRVSQRGRRCHHELSCHTCRCMYYVNYCQSDVGYTARETSPY